MSKLILALLFIGVLFAVTDARRRRDRGQRWWRFLGRDIEPDLGRNFRRWMNRDDQNVDSTPIEANITDTDDVIQHGEENNAGIDESNNRGRWHHHQRGRGDRPCRGPICRRINWRQRLRWRNQRRDNNNENENNNENLPSQQRRTWRERMQDRNDGLLDRENNENRNTETSRPNENMQLPRRRTWRARLQERIERRRQRNGGEMDHRRHRWQKNKRGRWNRRNRQNERWERRGRYLRSQFCQYVREIGRENEFSDICSEDIETTTVVDENSADVDINIQGNPLLY